MTTARLLAVLLLVAPPLCPGQASYHLRGGDPVPRSVAVNGYAQTVLEVADGLVRVEVATSYDPIGSDGAYPPPRPAVRWEVPPGFRIPGGLGPRLRAGAGAWEAATEVLRWVGRRLVVDPDDRGPQDASSVLARRTGRCSGLANATVALLVASGFDARTVSGVLVGDDAPPVAHRWVECRLPGAGWVPTDPTLGLWVVTSRHLVFPDTVRELPVVTRLGGTSDDLEHLGRVDGMVIRANEGATLVCRVVASQGEVLAVLSGPDGQERRSVLSPVGRFDGLVAGTWRLRLERDGRVVSRRTVELEGGGDHVLTISMGRGGG